MTMLTYLFFNIVETLLRMLPFPCKTGLIKIGHPDENSPVLLTCNFHLTVLRVKMALRGSDVYLLVANSKGINVWCASTGGLLTNHSVTSVLKTSGIEKLVSHRKVILPQLAATGVERKAISAMTGWRIIWGPVYAKDLPAFLAKKRKTPDMRQVGFPLGQRIEMAIAWAFPISIVTALLMLLIWPQSIGPLTGLIWALSFLIFISFPLYEGMLKPEGKRIGFIVFDFGRGGFQLLLWGLLILGIGFLAWMNHLQADFVIRWGVSSLVVVLLLSMDLMGSTPVFKSGLHEDRLFRVRVDEQKCRGASFCELVCPRNCFLVDRRAHKARMPNADRCVRCGACIVQCPYDALSFIAPNGEWITPETIRRYKLNMMGKRTSKVQ